MPTSRSTTHPAVRACSAPDATDLFTWWPPWRSLRQKNVGWRIDYQIATPKLAATAKRAAIYKSRRFSDHAPLTIDYDCAL